MVKPKAKASQSMPSIRDRVVDFRRVPASALLPNPKNWRLHNDAQRMYFRQLLERIGFAGAELVRALPDGRLMLIDGHMRQEELGDMPLPVLVTDLSESEADALLATFDPLGRLAGTDTDAANALIESLGVAGYDGAADLLRAVAENDQTAALLESLADGMLGGSDGEGEGQHDVDDPGGGGDDFDATPDESGPTRCQPGDLWQLGRHVIGCVDSLREQDLLRLMRGTVPDMVWADPPYGISIVATNVSVGGGEAYDIPFGGVKRARGDVGGGASHMRKTGKPYIAEQRLGSSDASKPFGSKDVRGSDRASNMIEVGKYAPVIGDDTTETAVAAYALTSRLYPKATHIWWGANYYANMLPPSSCWLVWDKENTGNFADCELAWCSEKSAVRLFRHMWNGLMKASERGQRRVHPTQKPVALAAWAFEKYGNAGGTILDPFLGSGMSLIAAERLGHTLYGAELSPEYLDVCLRRWETETGREATLRERISEPEYADTATS